MATPFSEVYDSFLTKIDDASLLSLTTENVESIMKNWLVSAITLFPKCKKDLNDIDEVLQQFNVDLNITEIEILSTWMKYSYLDKKVYRETLLKQSNSSKDNAMYSQANHLQQLINLKELTYREATKKVTDYMFNNTDFGDFG
jgi:pyruvate-formate lyase-activating enzyme